MDLCRCPDAESSIDLNNSSSAGDRARFYSLFDFILPTNNDEDIKITVQ